MKILLFAALLLGLSACSKTDDNGPFQDNDLSGSYQACAPPESALPGSGYRDMELQFSGNNFTTNTTYYSDPGCTGTNLGTENSGGTFSTSGNQIDYAYTGGVTIYDIYEVNGVNLKVGDRSGLNNGSSPELRPTAYDSTFEYSR